MTWAKCAFWRSQFLLDRWKFRPWTNQFPESRFFPPRALNQMLVWWFTACCRYLEVGQRWFQMSFKGTIKRFVITYPSETHVISEPISLTFPDLLLLHPASCDDLLFVKGSFQITGSDHAFLGGVIGVVPKILAVPTPGLLTPMLTGISVLHSKERNNS